MLAQIRTYTVSDGQMDAFLGDFKAEVMSLHERIGWPIIATLVDRSRNEFIWVRTYADEHDREAKERAFQEQRDLLGLKPSHNVTKREVRDVELAYVS
jgi:hypothetical protein